MDLLNLAGIYAGTFLVCAVSGLVPLVNAEMFMLYVGSIASRPQIPALILLAALGQMCAKIVLYQAGRGVLKLPLGRGQARLDALRERVSKSKRTDGVAFLSAVTGLPSFYGISLLAGTFGWPLPRFLAICVAGRILHFAGVLLLPVVVKGIL